MTIKQQGGVFGRHPEFSSVDVTGNAEIDGTLRIAEKVEHIGNTTANFGFPASNSFQVTTNNVQRVLVDSTGNVGIGITPTSRLHVNDPTPTNAPTRLSIGRSGWSSSTGYLEYDVGNASFTLGNTFSGYDIVMKPGGVEAARFKYGVGLALPSGLGIDFSATAGTGTSELFDDYEEGTWTPVYIPSSGSFASVTMDVLHARYTKIGQLVTINCDIRTDNLDVTGGSGAALISGLPFVNAGSANFAGSVSLAESWGGDYPIAAQVAGSGVVYLQYRTAVNGATSTVNVTDMSNGTNANHNRICLTASYVAS